MFLIHPLTLKTIPMFLLTFVYLFLPFLLTFVHFHDVSLKFLVLLLLTVVHFF